MIYIDIMIYIVVFARCTDYSSAREPGARECNTNTHTRGLADRQTEHVFAYFSAAAFYLQIVTYTRL